MKPKDIQHRLRHRRLSAAGLTAFFAATAFSASAYAAVDVFVIGNERAEEVASALTPSAAYINYTAWDGQSVPTVEELQQYDVVLLYASDYFHGAPMIGDAVAAYFETGGSIVTASGYMSNRSDGQFLDSEGMPNSWGRLEDYDTLIGLPGGIAFENFLAKKPYTLDEQTRSDAPVLEPVTSLRVEMAARRGNVSAKPTTRIVARWSNNNLFNSPDPLIGVREDGFSRSVGISISPLVSVDGLQGRDFHGDLEALWTSAILWAAADHDVAVVTNKNPAIVAQILYEEIEGMFFRPRDTRQLPTDLGKFDAALFFADGLITETQAMGDLLAQYYEGGGGVVHATFYLQGRSDGPFGYNWGGFEAYDTMESAGGSEDNSDVLDPVTMVDHPIMEGVHELGADEHRGGADLKPGARALAFWSTPNQKGRPDPLVTYRDDGFSRVVGLSIAAHYEYITRHASRPASYAGDLHVLVKNALVWAASRCGDGRVDSWETCDDANGDGGDGCSSSCEIETCGDGIVQEGEQCDDANAIDGDECLSNCQLAACGDGRVQAGVEECDDGAYNDDTRPNTCRLDCKMPFCGDGILDSGESCDHGHLNGGTLCSADCRLPTCGDGRIDPGEDCDLGAANSDFMADTCRATCVDPYCGDGVVDFNEECDEGRGINGTDASTCSRVCGFKRDASESEPSGEDEDEGPIIDGPARRYRSDDGGGCSQAPARSPGTAPLLVLGIIGLLSVRRR